MARMNQQTLNTLNSCVKSIFNKALKESSPLYPQITTKAASSGSVNVYATLGAFPSLREWVGDRVVKSLSVSSFTIENRKFESTVSISREQIEDDQIELFGSVIRDMSESAAIHPDELLFELIKKGFVQKCYDGVPFFSENHPVTVGTETKTVSNILLPKGKEESPLWLLIDNSRAVNPFIWQERIPYSIDIIDDGNNRDVFMRDEYFYGICGRGNMGYGLWQLAFASKAPLTHDNFKTLYDNMSLQKNDAGRPLRVTPKLLIVGQSNREAAFKIAKASILDTLAPNPNCGLVDVIVTPFLD
ncbi:TPA: Mu-like prophage major head subunit gpT family protein [Escherichia coli]